MALPRRISLIGHSMPCSSCMWHDRAVMNPSLDPVAVAARSVFVRHPKVRVALLFGSLARGTVQPSSDVDIAIAGAEVDLAQVASELSLVLGREVDVVSLESDPPIALIREVLRDGVRLYESEPGAEADLRTRLLWAVETDGPMIDAMAQRYIERLAARGRL